MFGSAFASSKMVVQELPFMIAATLRFLGGTVILLIFVFLFQRKSDSVPFRFDIKPCIAGLLGVFAYNGFFFGGVSLAPSIDGSIIVPVLSPIITVAILLVFKKEKLSNAKVIGLLLGLLGAIIFLYENIHGNNSSIHTRLLGDFFYILGALCWSLYTIVSKVLLNKNVSIMQSTAWSTFSGTCALSILAAPSFSTVDWSSLSNITWCNIIYLSVGPTALAYLFYYKGLMQVSASTATLMMFSVPMFGSFFSITLLGESFGHFKLVGAIFMLFGAFIAIFFKK